MTCKHTLCLSACAVLMGSLFAVSQLPIDGEMGSRKEGTCSDCEAMMEKIHDLELDLVKCQECEKHFEEAKLENEACQSSLDEEHVRYKKLKATFDRLQHEFHSEKKFANLQKWLIVAGIIVITVLVLLVLNMVAFHLRKQRMVLALIEPKDINLCII